MLEFCHGGLPNSAQSTLSFLHHVGRPWVKIQGFSLWHGVFFPPWSVHSWHLLGTSILEQKVSLCLITLMLEHQCPFHGSPLPGPTLTDDMHEEWYLQMHRSTYTITMIPYIQIALKTKPTPVNSRALTVCVSQPSRSLASRRAWHPFLPDAQLSQRMEAAHSLLGNGLPGSPGS